MTRNTPTHVGKTRSTSPAPRAGEKHPHARGEDLSKTRSRARKPETPPRTWGRHLPYSWAASFSRNTPTHVGKTLICSRRAAVT